MVGLSSFMHSRALNGFFKTASYICDMKKITTILLAAAISVSMASAQNPAARYINSLRNSNTLKEASWSVLAVKVKGDTIANLNSRLKLIPASNTKLITTGVALNELGADYRFKTKIAYHGRIEDGTLKGDVYIIGGGDPTIAATQDSCATPYSKMFASWAKMISDAGIKRIDGRIVGDGRWFDGMEVHGDWEYDDLGTYYSPGGNGLCFYENEVDFRAVPGATVGAPVSITQTWPETPWMSVSSIAKTSKAGSGDDLLYYATEMAPVGEMRGTLGIDAGTRKEECANRYGALTCAYYFYKHLESAGISVSEGPVDIDSQKHLRSFDGAAGPWAMPWDSLHVIGTSESPRLADIVSRTNHVSDNFYAETLLRTVGREKAGSAAYPAALEYELLALKKLGVDTSYGFLQDDGSGLSRRNWITTDFFVRFLNSMRKSSAWESYLASLPQPGKGTLSGRVNGAPQSDRSRIYMKSGSMGGVRCYSGYILPGNGKEGDTIVFSILTNNVTAPSRQLLPQLDRIIELIAAENR